MASNASGDALPTGSKIFTSTPDRFFIPEFVSGGLVWILVASTGMSSVNPLGWVMFVSISCFVVTRAWFFIFLCGANQSSIWPSLDVGYHFVAVLLYLSASVILAYLTIQMAYHNVSVFQLNISAVMSFVPTFFYFFHAIFSAIRWKKL